MDMSFSILESMPVLVYLQDQDYSIRFVNSYFRDLFGDHRDRRCYEIYHGRKEPCRKCPTLRVFETGSPIKRQWSGPDGRTYHIHDYPFTDSSGSILVLKLGIDITERKKMEDELIKARNLESIGILAGGIAHDYNNLLTSILGNISLAKMFAKPGDRIFELLNSAEESSIHARDLTHQMVSFARGKNPVKKSIHIKDFIKDTVVAVLDGSQSNFEFSFPDDLWPVEADEILMKQAVNNLVANACDALPKEGTIRIQAENLIVTAANTLPLDIGRYVRISFMDRGKGISRDDLPKVFDPYFTTKKMGFRRGKGFGLAVCYSIIKSHGGYITAESEAETGTDFSIYLPVREKDL